MKKPLPKGHLIDLIFNTLEVNNEHFFSCNEIIEKTGAKKSSVLSALIRMREQNQVIYKKGKQRCLLYQHKPVGATNHLVGFGGLA